MERFFILDKFNTWYDWRLILTSKDVTPPEPKINTVEIDGADGTLDLTESLTGEVRYNDRTVSASFWTNEGTFKERADLLKKIVNSLHGKKIKIIEPDDPDHYFYGRVTVKDISNISAYATFSIEAICEPWRYAIEETVRISSISGDVSTAGWVNPDDLPVTNIVINNNGSKTVIPTITVTGALYIYSDGIWKSFIGGTYKWTSLKLKPGANIISVKGGSLVTFTYREADL